MKIEVAEHSRMSESGSSLLRLIQNQSMPLLDLLVREAIQNSLDATNGKDRSVKVDIATGTFSSNALNVHFEGVQNALDARYPSSREYQFLAIRDMNTCGLTGPVRYEDVKNNEFGNLLKLVYEICKPQQNEGAGGSWGLGKTIYFRVGMGLVIYYSRICQNGIYSSRMAACLVEDETKGNAIIPSGDGVKRGIAWWGAADVENKTVPIEDENEINTILDVFGVSPYAGSDTGTTVIIPYVDVDKLLNEVYAKNEDMAFKPYWTNTLELYLEVAVQKWYAPRMLNSQYPYGAYLIPSINEERLRIKTMLPLFRIVRELYILIQNGVVEDSYIENVNGEVIVEDINVQKVFVPGNSSAGKFAFLKLSNEQLLMRHPENNKSPYQQIMNHMLPMEEGKNIPVIMYVRRPAMIVGYDYNGAWTHRMPRSGEDEYIIGLFVANSENKMKDLYDAKTGGALLFEEYIRQGENADHASWADRNILGHNPNVISKIQNGVNRKVSAQFKERDLDKAEKKSLGLGHALANILLPASDFGRKAKVPTIPQGKEKNPNRSNKSRKSAILKVGEPQFEFGKIIVDLELLVKRRCNLELQVITEFKKYNAIDWEEEIEKAFPLGFVQFELNSVSYKNEEKRQARAILTQKTQKVSGDEISIEFTTSKDFNVPATVLFIPTDECIVKCKAIFETTDSSIKGVFELKESKDESSI